jgi:hypothetical protein
VVSVKGHDLPLALRLDSASTSDFVAGPKTLEHLRKQLRDHSQMRLGAVILDAGHDGKPVYQFILHHDMTPVIPLSTKAPAQHPKRPEVQLSPRAVPLCPASAEMVLRGNNGIGGLVFGCPLKANKLQRCPHAPEGAERLQLRAAFAARPHGGGQDLRRRAALSADTAQSSPVPQADEPALGLRTELQHQERFKLLFARHRRASFWLIRVYLIALLQHGLAWVQNEDPMSLVDHLLGRRQSCAA